MGKFEQLGENSSQLTGCGVFFQIVFVIFNLIFVGIGLALLGVGIYLHVTAQDYAFITGDSLLTGAVILMICGIVTFIIATIGFVGACFKWRPLLVIYALILFIMVVLEFAAGILGFVFRNEVLNLSNREYQDRWNNSIKLYRAQDEPGYDPSVNNAVDFFQRTLKCCGINQPSDWGTLNGLVLNALGNQLPASCSCTSGTNCGNVTFQYSYPGPNDSQLSNIIQTTAWDKGCINATINAVVSYTTYIGIAGGGVGLVVALIEILGIFISLALCCCITQARKLETV